MKKKVSHQQIIIKPGYVPTAKIPIVREHTDYKLSAEPYPASLPHPFKCSKCAYVGKSKTDFNDHWSLEH